LKSERDWSNIKNNTKGVSYCSRRRKFRAVFNRSHLGYFETEGQAIEAIEKTKKRNERVKAMMGKAFADDKAAQESDPDGYFFRHKADNPKEWAEAEQRALGWELK
jgi:hypothetical protein